MKRIIAIFSFSVACAIAMNSACTAAENNQSSAGSPIVVAQAKQPTDADKKKLSDDIKSHYKPGPGSKSGMSGGAGGATRMDAGSCTQSSTVIAACSASCSAACIFKCAPPASYPWSSDCKTCVNGCMDKCTGCGTGSSQ